MNKKSIVFGIVGIFVALLVVTSIAVPITTDFYSSENTTKTVIHDNSTSDTTATIVGNVTSEFLGVPESGANPESNTTWFVFEVNSTNQSQRVNISTKGTGFVNIDYDNMSETIAIDGEDLTLNVTNATGEHPNEVITVDYTYSNKWEVPPNILNLIAMIIVLIFVGLIAVVTKPFNK